MSPQPRRSRKPAGLRLSFLALLACVLALVPVIARAAPDTEKLTLSGAGTGTPHPIAVASYPPLGLFLVANRDADTVSLFELPALGPVLNPADDLEPLNLAVVDDPVAIAVWDNATPMSPMPTKAYAFVAGFNAHAISVIDLMAEPPAVLTSRQINLVPDADSMTPFPIALAVTADRLVVATHGDGTAMYYNITGLPAATPTHVMFPVDVDLDRSSAAGNAIVCQPLTNVAPGARPRVLHFLVGAMFAGCDNGNFSQFFPDGEVNLVTSTISPNGIAALAGDPRGDRNILYLLVDDLNGVFAFDLDAEDDPDFITQLCEAGTTIRDSIPLTASANSTAMIAYEDPSDSSDWLLVLSTGAASSFLEVISLAQIDGDGMNLPECGIDAEDGISYRVPLTLGVTNFPSTVTPSGIAQQIAAINSYVAIPNYGASGGMNTISLVTDAPLLTPVGAGTLAVGHPNAAGNAFDTVVTMLDLVFDTDEDLDGSEVFAFARLKGTLAGMGFTPLTYTYAEFVATIGVSGVQLGDTLGLDEMDNDTIEVQLALPDTDGDAGFVAREIVFDTTRPSDPANVSVAEGSNELTVSVSPAVDVMANDVQSGLGGFYVVFTAAVDENDQPLATLPDPRRISSTSPTFQIAALTNRVTYTFDVYVMDRAGNTSTASVEGSGTPVPGISLLDLVGEDGCVYSPRGSGWGAHELLLWLGVAAIVLIVRRREARR